MLTHVETTANFDREIEKLARKYPAVLDQVEHLIDELEEERRPGDKIPGTGFDVYKARLRNPSARRGKRGGFRVVYYVKSQSHVILITIYSKTGRANIHNNEIRQILNDML